MPPAVYRYFLHFACVCHTQGPQTIFALGGAQSSPQRARLFHLTLGTDYRKHFCAQQLPGPAFPGCSSASLLGYPSSQGSAGLAVGHQECPCHCSMPSTGTRSQGKDPSPPSQAVCFHCLLFSSWHSSCSSSSPLKVSLPGSFLYRCLINLPLVNNELKRCSDQTAQSG